MADHVIIPKCKLCKTAPAKSCMYNGVFLAKHLYNECSLAGIEIPRGQWIELMGQGEAVVIPDVVFRIIQQAKDSICAGGLAENAQHERSIVEPYLDGIMDELNDADSTTHPAPAVDASSASDLLAKAADYLEIMARQPSPLCRSCADDRLGDMCPHSNLPCSMSEFTDKLRAAGKAGTPSPEPVQADEMVSRFLSWKLPEDFAPDGHINFDPAAAKSSPQSWPIGTNLFTAEQAKEVVLHMLKNRRLEEGERATKAVAALVGAFEGIGAGRKARRDDREGLSVTEEPRPKLSGQAEIKTLSTQLHAVTELLRAREREIAEMKQPAQPMPKCITCNDHGMIGGPSYREPDEGGVPCPDCAAQPIPTGEPQSMAGRERYKVVRTTSGFWPYCIKAGDGERQLYLGHKKTCDRVAAELATAFEDGKFVAGLTRPEAPGGVG